MPGIKAELWAAWLNDPCTRHLAHKLHRMAKKAAREQLECDPFTEAERIARARITRQIIRDVLSLTIEAQVNRDKPVDEAPFSILKWLRSHLTSGGP